MDGRIQLPVIHYLQEHFGTEYVDVVTEPGPNGILASGSDQQAVESIEKRVRISVEKHASVGIAVVGHHDCAGNPTPEDLQKVHIAESMAWAKANFAVPVIGLWVDHNWQVSRV
jgi:hypothetical protein